MNGSYYKSPLFPNEPIYERDTAVPNQNNDLPMEQSYIENILRLNKGRKATIYVSFPDSINWKDKIFTGIIEQAGRDHIIISNPNNGEWYLLLTIYIDYFKFYEAINYSPEFIPN